MVSNHMESIAHSCGKCGAPFKYKKNLTKHASLEQCGKKRGRSVPTPRKSVRKAANSVHNEPIPISRSRVSETALFVSYRTARRTPHTARAKFHASCTLVNWTLECMID
jgi:uncharacterized C2H2 Zn-finger protein